jgi:CRISPR-associated endonuclease Cas1
LRGVDARHAFEPPPPRLARTIHDAKGENIEAVLVVACEEDATEWAYEVWTDDVATVIRRELEKLASCKTLQALRGCESVAGCWYWQTLAAIPVTFDTRWRAIVPAHWRSAGNRTSPPSGFKSSRKAATPFHALVNYAYAILETEATITLHTHGFDPGLGILHTDKRYRGSLAHDLMEPVRPLVDGMILDLLAEHALQRGDVYETREGVCRLGPPMARRLARWAPALRPALAEHASGLATLLLGGRSTRPARRRNATTAGKGGKRRLAGRASL